MEAADLKDIILAMDRFLSKGGGPPGYVAVHQTLFGPDVDGTPTVIFSMVASPLSRRVDAPMYKGKAVVTPFSELLGLDREGLVDAVKRKWHAISEMPWELLGEAKHPPQLVAR